MTRNSLPFLRLVDVGVRLHCEFNGKGPRKLRDGGKVVARSPSNYSFVASDVDRLGSAGLPQPSSVIYQFVNNTHE